MRTPSRSLFQAIHTTTFFQRSGDKNSRVCKFQYHLMFNMLCYGSQYLKRRFSRYWHSQGHIFLASSILVILKRTRADALVWQLLSVNILVHNDAVNGTFPHALSQGQIRHWRLCYSGVTWIENRMSNTGCDSESGMIFSIKRKGELLNRQVAAT